MRKYTEAELEILTLQNDVIATSDPDEAKDEHSTNPEMGQGRRSIWN